MTIQTPSTEIYFSLRNHVYPESFIINLIILTWLIWNLTNRFLLELGYYVVSFTEPTRYGCVITNIKSTSKWLNWGKITDWFDISYSCVLSQSWSYIDSCAVRFHYRNRDSCVCGRLKHLSSPNCSSCCITWSSQTRILAPPQPWTTQHSLWRWTSVRRHASLIHDHVASYLLGGVRELISTSVWFQLLS
jgi:hypothetical protein